MSNQLDDGFTLKDDIQTDSTFMMLPSCVPTASRLAIPIFQGHENFSQSQVNLVKSGEISNAHRIHSDGEEIAFRRLRLISDFT